MFGKTLTLDYKNYPVLFVDDEDRLLGANPLGLSYNGLDESAIGRVGFSGLLRDQGLREAVSGKLDEIIQLDLHDSGRSYRAEVRPMSGEESDGIRPFRGLLIVRNSPLVHQKLSGAP